MEKKGGIKIKQGKIKRARKRTRQQRKFKIILLENGK